MLDKFAEQLGLALLTLAMKAGLMPVNVFPRARRELIAGVIGVIVGS
jgi:hypothetical protein